MEDLEGMEGIDLGQGDTPLVEFLSGLWLKLEYLNPTGSFKDRGSSLAISYARMIGKTTVVEDSSGNAGMSVAAYAADVGMRAKIYVPADSPRGKLALLRLFGAETVKAGDRDDARKAAADDKTGYYVGHITNPFFIAGMEEIVREIVDDLGGAPEYIVTPVASGTLLLGIWRGLRRLGMKSKLVAVQACGFVSLDGAPTKVLSCSRGSRLADAIRLGDPPRKGQIIDALLESDGYIYVVDDDVIIGALRDLWNRGIVAEPTSAASYAVAKAMYSKGARNIVALITGSGLKYIDTLSELLY